MAKKSIIQRDYKKKSFYKRYSLIKNFLLKKLKVSKSLIYKFNIHLLPKNSFVNRISNRCFVSGRSRGVFSKFSVSRFVLRNKALNGEIPGFIKSSW